MMFELTLLHVLYQRKIELGHEVLVHVQKNISYHNYALLNLGPDSIELLQEFLVRSGNDVLCDGLQKFHGCIAHAVIKHLSMFVQNQMVSSAIELLVRQGTSFLVVDLVDCILDCFPVLLNLRTLHVCISHFVPVNQKLVGWKT